MLVEELNFETLRAETDCEYDVVIADHSGGKSCIVEIANELITENGLVVFDNSDRELYFHIEKPFSQRGFGYNYFLSLLPGLRYVIECNVLGRNFHSLDWPIQLRQSKL